MILEKEESASRVAYRLMNQHAVSEGIKFLTMCPTMDLIATCTMNGDVWVARWFTALEKNWTLPSFKYQNENVETITWRPDGTKSSVSN
jgi:hypothetical protein